MTTPLSAQNFEISKFSSLAAERCALYAECSQIGYIGNSNHLIRHFEPIVPALGDHAHISN